MDVLFVPDYAEANPYQQELREALAAENIAVKIANGAGITPVIDAARSAGWPDVVHLHWMHPYLIGSGRVTTAIKGVKLLFELLVLRLFGVRLIWTVHNKVEHDRRAPYLERGFKHVIVRLCGTVFVHCSSARSALIRSFRLPERYRSRFVEIPHGHYIDSYPEGGEPSGIDPAVLSDGVTFLFFGQIRPYKNVPELIDAFATLDAPADLLIVGNPVTRAIRERVERKCRAHDNVHSVLEFVPDSNVTAYFDLADVAVLPYEEILTSGTVVLAMSRGKPVVTPTIGCLSELLADAGEASAALGYRASRPGALADAMRRSIDADRDAIGAQNRALVRSHDWTHIARRTKRAYEQSVPANSAPSSPLSTRG